jgi:hypothetical protein
VSGTVEKHRAVGNPVCAVDRRMARQHLMAPVGEVRPQDGY